MATSSTLLVVGQTLVRVITVTRSPANSVPRREIVDTNHQTERCWGVHKEMGAPASRIVAPKSKSDASGQSISNRKLDSVLHSSRQKTWAKKCPFSTQFLVLKFGRRRRLSMLVVIAVRTHFVCARNKTTVGWRELAARSKKFDELIGSHVIC